MKSNRMLRINELIRRELGELCEREIAVQARGLLTVTRVETSPDLRQANVYVSVMAEPEERRHFFRLLHERRGHFQREIGRRIEMKYTPVLHFELDELQAKADRVLAMIDHLQLPADPATPTPAPPTDTP